MGNENIEGKLKLTNKEIAKDVTKIVICGAAICVGVFGTVVFTKELIDYYAAAENITLDTYYSAGLRQAKPAFTFLPVALGGIGIMNTVSTLKENIAYKRYLKKNNNLRNN